MNTYTTAATMLDMSTPHYVPHPIKVAVLDTLGLRCADMVRDDLTTRQVFADAIAEASAQVQAQVPVIT